MGCPVCARRNPAGSGSSRSTDHQCLQQALGAAVTPCTNGGCCDASFASKLAGRERYCEPPPTHGLRVAATLGGSASPHLKSSRQGGQPVSRSRLAISIGCAYPLCTRASDTDRFSTTGTARISDRASTE